MYVSAYEYFLQPLLMAFLLQTLIVMMFPVAIRTQNDALLQLLLEQTVGVVLQELVDRTVRWVFDYVMKVQCRQVVLAALHARERFLVLHPGLLSRRPEVP